MNHHHISLGTQALGLSYLLTEYVQWRLILTLKLLDTHTMVSRSCTRSENCFLHTNIDVQLSIILCIWLALNYIRMHGFQLEVAVVRLRRCKWSRWVSFSRCLVYTYCELVVLIKGYWCFRIEIYFENDFQFNILVLELAYSLFNYYCVIDITRGISHLYERWSCCVGSLWWVPRSWHSLSLPYTVRHHWIWYVL